MKKLYPKQAIGSIKVELDFLRRAIEADDPKSELLMRVKMMQETINRVR